MVFIDVDDLGLRPASRILEVDCALPVALMKPSRTNQRIEVGLSLVEARDQLIDYLEVRYRSGLFRPSAAL